MERSLFQAMGQESLQIIKTNKDLQRTCNIKCKYAYIYLSFIFSRTRGTTQDIKQRKNK